MLYKRKKNNKKKINKKDDAEAQYSDERTQLKKNKINFVFSLFNFNKFPFSEKHKSALQHCQYCHFGLFWFLIFYNFFFLKSLFFV